MQEKISLVRIYNKIGQNLFLAFIYTFSQESNLMANVISYEPYDMIYSIRISVNNKLQVESYHLII